MWHIIRISYQIGTTLGSYVESDDQSATQNHAREDIHVVRHFWQVLEIPIGKTNKLKLQLSNKDWFIILRFSS